MDVSEIVEALGGLSRDDLAKVHKSTGLLLGTQLAESTGKVNIIDATSEQAIAFEAMVLELKKAGLREEVSFDRFSRTTVFRKNWRRSIKELEAFVDRSFPGANKNDRRWFYMLGFSLLLTDMKRAGIPTGLGTLAANTDRMLEQINREFPDYIACGLGRFIMKAAEQRARDAE